MLYVKNVPTAERVIRVIMGLALLGGTLAWFGPTLWWLDVGRHGHDGCPEWTNWVVPNVCHRGPEVRIEAIGSSGLGA